MTKSARTIVYIDGENFMHRIMDMLRPELKNGRSDLIDLKVRHLVEGVIGADGQNVEIRYYTTKLRLAGLPTEAQAKLRVMSDFNSRFMPRLIRQGIAVVRAGILRSREYDPCPKCGQVNSYFIEKGVDVRLSVDMVIDAQQTNVGRLILISSDLDILPAITAVRDLGKKLDYLTSSKDINRALTASVDETFTFSRSDVQDALRIG